MKKGQLVRGWSSLFVLAYLAVLSKTGTVAKKGDVL
jgi:hypothetical protein